MSRSSASIVIRRPVSEVFAYMDDVSREIEWQPNLQLAEKHPEGPTVVGTEKRYENRFLGRKVKNTYVVKELEPERRIVYETTGESAVSVRSEFVWEKVEQGTRVTIYIDGKGRGVLKLIPQKVIEVAFSEELRNTLDRLREQMESSSGAEPEAP